MQHVLVVDATRRPLIPCRPARARRLLTQHQAAVLRRYPFTIILTTAKPEAMVVPVRLKIDPGSRTTGLSLVSERPTSTSAAPSATGQTQACASEVVWAGELTHRGEEIHQALTKRRAIRRARRQRHTRYRAARFANRTRPAGWLPPSLESRVQHVVTWVQRLARWCPVDALSLEAVRFDTQLLQNPDIAGVEYQQGTLAGTEVREYLLLKWGYRCAYCHEEATSTNRWEIDHILPRSRGGSDRPSNLALSCHACNQAKGDRTAAEFGHPEVQAQAKAPLEGCRSRQQHPARAASAAAGTRAAGGDGKWRSHQMEPDPARGSEDPLAGCPVRRREYARADPGLAGDDAARDQRPAVAAAADVFDEWDRVPTHKGQRSESSLWLQNGRQGESRGAHWEAPRHPCGQSSDQSEWRVYDHDQTTNGTRCAVSLLSARTSS